MPSATSAQLENWVKKAVDTRRKLGLACTGTRREVTLKFFKQVGRMALKPCVDRFTQNANASLLQLLGFPEISCKLIEI